MHMIWLLATWYIFYVLHFREKQRHFIQLLTKQILHLEYDSLKILFIFILKTPKTAKKRK